MVNACFSLAYRLTFVFLLSKNAMRTLTQLTLLPLLLILVTLILWLFQYQRWREHFLANVDLVNQSSTLVGERLLLDLRESPWQTPGFGAVAKLDLFGDARIGAEASDWQRARIVRLGERVRLGTLPESGMAFDLYDGQPQLIVWRPSADEEGREVRVQPFDEKAWATDTHPLAITHRFDWDFASTDALIGQPGAAALILRNARGQAVGRLLVEPSVDVLAMSLRMIAWQWRDFALLLGSFFLLATAYVLTRLALPLARIERALANSQRPELKSLLDRRDEIGRIARSMDTFFEQQESLKREIEAREVAEASLEQSQWDLRRAMERREQLARDLHDGMIQEVYSLGLAIKRLKRFFSASEKAVADAELERISNQVNAMIAELRALLAELEPVRLQGEQLGCAIERLAESFRHDTGADVSVDIPEALVAEIPHETRLQVFHIIHEAFANAVRHGRASQLSCRLQRSGQEGLLLSVEDNGQGFVAELAAEGGGRGLRNMRERARAVGMDLSIHSQIGGPTRIVMEGL
jgi:signal transduction histidine kinase